LLVSDGMPEPISFIARHAWFAVRDRGGWHRVEVGGGGGEPLEKWGAGDVRVHGVWRGAEAERAIPCLGREAEEYHRTRRYLVWPGPNSNTFVDVLLRACGLHADLPVTNIGKDYRGPIGVSLTSGGTGVQLETPLFGLKLGLKEGVELHLMGVGIGIDLWPPALIVPFGPGRLGFDDR
jgi:hypothetical protein